jgi:hypothetical protein
VAASASSDRVRRRCPVASEISTSRAGAAEAAVHTAVDHGHRPGRASTGAATSSDPAFTG